MEDLKPFEKMQGNNAYFLKLVKEYNPYESVCNFLSENDLNSVDGQSLEESKSKKAKSNKGKIDSNKHTRVNKNWNLILPKRFICSYG